MIDQWPALTFRVPSPFLLLTAEERQNMGRLGSDFCQIEHPGHTERFIRVTMVQKVNDHCTNLEYGLWVSLNEENFLDYWKNFENDGYVAEYTGLIANDFPGYDSMASIPVTVKTRTGGQRPEIFPQEGHDHPFVQDFYRGISKSEAERRIKELFLNKLPKN
jgi:hypothetical protein